MDALKNHTLKAYPHIWIDTYLFFAAILFVIGTAAFSVVANATKLPMWYPLAMLSVPAIIAYYTTKRRNVYYRKLAKVWLMFKMNLELRFIKTDALLLLFILVLRSTSKCTERIQLFRRYSTNKMEF